MCMILEDWLREESRIQFWTQAIGTNYVQILPYDPMRFAISFSGEAPTTWVAYTFADSTPSNTTWFATVGSQPAGWLRRDWGDLVTRPLWGRLNAGSVTLTIITCSYNVERKKLYDRAVREHISKLGAL